MRLFAFRLLLVCVAVLVLAGCEAAPKEKSKIAGARVAIMEVGRKKIIPDADLSDYSMNIPKPVKNDAWPQAGGNTVHNLIHPDLGASLELVWDSSIGTGSGGAFRLLAQPVIADGKVFTLDAVGRVRAFETTSGDRVWKFDTTPEDRDGKAMGGGLGYFQNTLYVTTGFGEVLALSASDGQVIWRKNMLKPLRAAPTIADRKIYIITIDNELHALDAKTGDQLWKHVGMTESATLMGSSSPAVIGDTVVVTYTSGEIYSLRTQNGRIAWSDVLASPTQVGALPAIADIRGLPVIDRGRVYVISHSGRMASIDLRTGDRVWEAEVGGVNTPVVSGDVVFVLSNDSELIALTRDNGRIIWSVDLPRYDDPTDSTSDPIRWTGPVLAGNNLWLTNSFGQVMSYATKDGDLQSFAELDDPIFIAPAVADKTLYIVTDKGRLVALH